MTSAVYVETLQTEISILKQELTSWKEKVSLLEEQLAWFKRQIFGKRSEKIVPNQDSVLLLPGFELPEATKEPETRPVPAHVRRKPNRNGQDAITLPDDIPVERIVLDLPEQEKVCKETGEPLVKIGEEITRKIAQKPGSYYVKEIVRPKYASPMNPDAGVATADLPDSLLPRCQADESFLADILVKKFGDHLPLYRQSEMLRREDIFISRQTLCQWVIKCGIALKPLRDCMIKLILDGENVFVDETPIDMLAPGNGKVKKAFMWTLVGGPPGQDPPYRIFEFYENRNHCNAADLLKDYHGVLHSDKYGGYVALAKAKQFTWCPCWSHIRRKFFEAESGDPKFRAWVLRKIRYLFLFEKVAWARSPEERLQIRQDKEVPIIDEIIHAVKERLFDGALLPKSKFREALGYLNGSIPYLKNYTLHPFSRLDNNVAERAIRPLAIGRKNWLFVGNENGGETAAVVFSLVQTCRALNVNPREYLEDVMRRLMRQPANKLYELLPDQWARARQASQNSL